MKNPLFHLPFFALYALLLTLPLVWTGCSDDSTDDSTPAPVLTVETDESGSIAVAAAGGETTLFYRISDPIEGRTVTAMSEDVWLHDFDNAAPGRIVFTVDENTEYDRPRTGRIFLDYSGAEQVVVSVVQSDPVKPIDIRITEVTVASIKAEFAALDPEMTFLFDLVKKSDYDALGSDEAFLENEYSKLEAEAVEYEFDSLADYLDFLLGDRSPEEQRLTREGLEINTDYYVYAYGIDTKGVLTSRLVKRAVKTNDLKEIDFRLAIPDPTQRSATLTADPDDASTLYFLGYVAQKEYQTLFHGSDEEIVNNVLGNIRLAIGSDNTQLDRVTCCGKTSLPIDGLLPGTAYYALAFGVDASVSACTKLTKVPFETQPFVATDGCSFTVDVPSCNSALMSIHVVPTVASTRYYVTIKAASEVQELTPGMVADMQIDFENGFHMDWAGDKQIFTGERTLHSRRDIGATHIKPETDYVIYVFGVDEQGNRTTDVATATVTTTAVQPSSMQLSIQSIVAGAETDPDDWFGGKMCNFQFEVIPSTNEEYYYVGIVEKSGLESYASDEAFMDAVVAESGEMMILGCYLGRQSTPFKGSYTYKGDKLQSGTEYCIFAFGYMGGVTTGLFKETATADDGEGGGGDWNPWG